jgi:hypothetical protein
MQASPQSNPNSLIQRLRNSQEIVAGITVAETAAYISQELKKHGKLLASVRVALIEKVLKERLEPQASLEDKIGIILHIITITISSDAEMWASFLLWLAEKGGPTYQQMEVKLLLAGAD